MFFKKVPKNDPNYPLFDKETLEKEFGVVGSKGALAVKDPQVAAEKAMKNLSEAQKDFLEEMLRPK